MRRMVAIVLGTLAAGVACKDTSGNSTGTPSANEVFMQNSAFTPTTRTVTLGTSITWVNNDGITHTVTSSAVPAGSTTFNSSVNATGSFSRVFSTNGTYQYYCTIHGTPTTGMRATVIVN